MLCAFFLSFNAHAEKCEDLSFSIHCPADVTVDCHAELWDLSEYGNAYYHDYDGNHDAGQPYVSENLSSCNTGTITRTWTVEDEYWNMHSCSQTITVGGGTGGFGYHNINWPIDFIELEGCHPAYEPHDLPQGYGYPTYDYVECSLIGVTYTDQIFNISNQCKKIRRTYKVIDWCTYDDSSWGSHNSGLYEFVQTIKISSTDIPQIDYTDEIEFSSYNCDDKNVVAPPLYLPPATCGGDFMITNNSPYATENGADLSGTYPVGTTKVKFTVTYGCTGRKYHTVDIVVKDASGPQVYCFGEITTALMPMDDNNDGIVDNGMVEIWAKDLDKGSSSSCDSHPVEFSFSEDVTDNVKVFTCDDVGDNYIYMYVTDYKGNQSRCQVNVRVQNNSANIPNCEPQPEDPTMYNVAGRISMASQASVEEAEVSLRSTQPIVDEWVGFDTVSVLVSEQLLNPHGEWVTVQRYEDKVIFGNHETISYGEASIMTDAQGNYMLDQSVRSDGEYMVTATYEGQDSHIGYEDVKALLHHIQDKTLLQTAYEHLAADINQDGTIDHKDLAKLMQYVSGAESTLSDKDWIMVDASHSFTNPNDIIAGNCPEAIYFNTQSEDISNKDFIAVRIGDLSDETLIFVSNNQQSLIGDSANNSSNAVDQAEALIRSLELVNEISVTAHPNPFKNDLVLNHQTNTEENVTIEILDVTGKRIYTQNVQAEKGLNQYKINIDDQVSGLLICKIKGAYTDKTIKVIKE